MPETKLTALPVNRSFLWDKQEILILAVYVGKAGAALDVCAKIPTEDMAAFLTKWDYERRMSLKTPEDFDQLDADNLGSREFAVKVSLDDTPLLLRMSSSLRWYPENIIQMENVPASEDGFENNKSAEEWMNTYDCDRECCQILSYSITPEIDQILFTIRDCAESDQPRMGDAQGQPDRPDGPTAVFMTGKNTAPEKRSAVSSLHFEPVPEVQWRVIFQIKPKNDAETSFPIKA